MQDMAQLPEKKCVDVHIIVYHLCTSNGPSNFEVTSRRLNSSEGIFLNDAQKA